MAENRIFPIDAHGNPGPKEISDPKRGITPKASRFPRFALRQAFCRGQAAAYSRTTGS